MNALREWWSQQTDYSWNVRYAQSHPVLRHSRIAVGLCCWAYGLICVVALATPVMPQGWAYRIVVGVFALTTVAVGYAWVKGPWPGHKRSLLFIAYGEIGVSCVLFCLDDPSVALLCASLLGVMGNYVAAFHDSKAFVAHQLWALGTCGYLYVESLTDTDIPFTQATAYLIVLIMVLVASPVLTQAYLTFLRRDAAVAHFDPLTGLRNRRGLESAIDTILGETHMVTVLVADLDNFKSVNDNHGHSYGDDVLRRTAVTLNRTFPAPAVTARTGGEEFVVVTTASLSSASTDAERLRTAIPGCNPVGRTTTSIGVVHRRLDCGTIRDVLDEMLDDADAAMYEAKRRGGDSVVIESVDDAPVRPPRRDSP